jgi:hypothetical protein
MPAAGGRGQRQRQWPCSRCRTRVTWLPWKKLPGPVPRPSLVPAAARRGQIGRSAGWPEGPPCGRAGRGRAGRGCCACEGLPVAPSGSLTCSAGAVSGGLGALRHPHKGSCLGLFLLRCVLKPDEFLLGGGRRRGWHWCLTPAGGGQWKTPRTVRQHMQAIGELAPRLFGAMKCRRQLSSPVGSNGLSEGG